ncbi:MAG: hypothetical protein ACI9KE_004730 [Polyangiales bacterium]
MTWSFGRLAWVISASCLGAASLSAISACDNVSTFSQVPVMGLPDCAESLLQRSIVVEMNSGDTTMRRTFSGHGARQPTVDVRDGRREWEVRFGVCRNTHTPESHRYDCGDVDWYDEQTLEIDTAATPSLAVPPPPESDCAPVAQ